MPIATSKFIWPTIAPCGHSLPANGTIKELIAIHAASKRDVLSGSRGRAMPCLAARKE